MPQGPIKCQICREDAEHIPNDPYRDSTRIDCRRCGRYEVTESVVTENLDQNQVAVLSHSIRRMQESNELPLLTTHLKREILRNGRIPLPNEQADLFLLWMCRQIGHNFGTSTHVFFLTAAGVMGAASWRDAIFVLKHLEEEGLIRRPSKEILQDRWNIQVTMKGWARYNDLLSAKDDSRLAFMAMPFGKKLLDDNFVEHWKPAVAQTGFDLRRLDDNQTAGVIDDRLRVEIRKSRFLIAELTEENRGAYWEAGFAEGLGRPVFYLCEAYYFKKHKTHFDTNHSLTIIWTAEDIAPAVEELKAAIRNTLPSESQLSDEATTRITQREVEH